MSVRRIPANRDKLLIVCGKCAKRTGGDALAKPLRKALKPLGYDVVASRCMGLCPGKATAMRDAARPAEWLIVKHGTSTDAIVAELVEPPRVLEPPLQFRSFG